MTESFAQLSVSRELATRFLHLLGSEGNERIFLREVLELWRVALGSESIAAYISTESGFERWVCLGSEPFPQHLDRTEPVLLERREIGSGLIVYPTSEGSLATHLELLAAAALRLCASHAQLKQHDFDAKYRGVELEAIYDVGLAIASTLDLSALSEEILLRAVSLLDARRGALYLLDEGSYCLQSTIGGSAAESLELQAGGQGESTNALPGAANLLTVPIEIEDDPRGLLTVADKESRTGVGPFDDSDHRSLAHFANQAALALEQARLHREALEKERLEREMQLASTIQRGILPQRLPVVEGYELGGWTRPARHVGGDYYDMLMLPDGRLVTVVADVSGKGVPAALLVSTLHSALRLLLDHEEDLAELGHRLNAHLYAFTAANKYATLFVALLDPATGNVAYLNAGHNPAVLVRTGGEVEMLGASGVPVGLLPIADYRCGEVELGPGDLLCIYSDGITEAVSRSDEEYGPERLRAGLEQRLDSPLAVIRRQVESAIEEFTDGLPQGDDQTLVFLRRC